MKLLFTTDFSIDNTSLKNQYITRLENLILGFNSNLLEGQIIVNDEVYTNCMELLNIISPESPLLENDKEVHFIKDLDEETLAYLKEKLEGHLVLNLYPNPVGLNVRITYEDGILKKAVTFGRAFKNQDITYLMKRILTDRNDCLTEFSDVIVEGTVVLPFENIIMAESCAGIEIKDEYQGIFALLHEDELTDGELGQLEDFLTFIATDIHLDGFPLETLEDKYNVLESGGFVIPDIITAQLTDDIEDSIKYALMDVEQMGREVYYLSDGARLCLPNDKDVIMFKTGSWQIVTYEAVIKDIQWIDKKCKKYPKLVFEEPIKIGDDFEISEFVLQNINLLLILDLDIGEIIRFGYFGALGVLPITDKNEIIVN